MNTIAGGDQVLSAARTACRRIARPPQLRHCPASGLATAFSHLEFSGAAAATAAVSGSRMTMPRVWYAQLLHDGIITDEDIATALKESLSDHVEWLTVADVKQHSQQADPDCSPLPLIANLAQVAGIDDVAAYVTESITAWFGSYFNHPTCGRSPDLRAGSLYAAWREETGTRFRTDHSRLAGMQAVVTRLPASAEELLATAASQLGLHVPGLANWFHRQLASIHPIACCSDWLCQPDRQDADLEAALLDLLAIRVAWDLALFQLLRDETPLEATWTRERNALLPAVQHSPVFAVDCVLQTAYELAWQRSFLSRLRNGLPAVAQPPPAVQAVFCSGMRTESIRLALESCSPLIETLGVAGYPVDMPGASVGKSVVQRSDVAEALLTTMSLKDGCAGLVILVGHATTAADKSGSSEPDPCLAGTSANIERARVAAAILNDWAVRAVLAGRKIMVPPRTVFVAARHDAALNQLLLVEADTMSPEQQRELEQARLWLQYLSPLVRNEPVRSRGFVNRILQSVRLFRHSIGSQPPEPAFAGYAAVIAAPRELTRSVDFGGQAALFSYRWQQDTGYRVLEQLMTVQLPAASEANLQCYAATTSASHDVVDSMQRQEPVRLSAVLAAPIAEIDRIINRHSGICSLVTNDWIHIFAVSPCGQKILRRSPLGGWSLVRNGGGAA